MIHERNYVKNKAISSGSKELWEKYKNLRKRLEVLSDKVRRIIKTNIFTMQKAGLWRSLKCVEAYCTRESKENKCYLYQSDVDEYTEAKSITDALKGAL